MARKLRVYDNKGDFLIEIPEDAKVTFGYFNPSSSAGGAFNRNDYGNNNNVARQTALRIYSGKTEKSNQIACFIGVNGFRDESIELTRLVEEITLTREFTDNGEGNIVDNRAQKALVKAVKETSGVYN